MTVFDPPLCPLGEGKGEGRRPCAADPRPHPGPLPRGEGGSRLPGRSTFLLDAVALIIDAAGE